MCVCARVHLCFMKQCSILVHFVESVSLVGYPEDSDSENEEGVMEKLASAIGHLFTGYDIIIFVT